MWSTYLLIFLMLCIGAAGWLLFLWAVKSGQYDDVEGPKYRMLDDDAQETPDTDVPKQDRQHPSHPGGQGDGAEHSPDR